MLIWNVGEQKLRPTTEPVENVSLMLKFNGQALCSLY